MHALATQLLAASLGLGTADPLGIWKGPQSAGLSAVPDAAVVERHLAAMGTWLELEVWAADRSTALAASEAAVRAIEEVEGRLSTWRTDTELARLNAHPQGESFALSPALAADLRQVRDLVRLTGGAFDPAIAPLVSAWGLRIGGRRPSAAERKQALADSGFRHLHLAEDRAQRLNANVALEEGGFGKGIGLEAAVRAARLLGATGGRIDLGGQIALFGEAECTLGIAHPRRRDEVVVELTIGAGSLATSGNSERGIVVDGERRAHILDPRTGMPAHDFGSITVWASDATRADALSTALFVMGPEEALAFAAAHDDCDVVCIIDRGEAIEVHAGSEWAGRLRSLSPAVTLSFVSPRPAKKK